MSQWFVRSACNPWCICLKSEIGHSFAEARDRSRGRAQAHTASTPMFADWQWDDPSCSPLVCLSALFFSTCLSLSLLFLSSRSVLSTYFPLQFCFTLHLFLFRLRLFFFLSIFPSPQFYLSTFFALLLFLFSTNFFLFFFFHLLFLSTTFSSLEFFRSLSLHRCPLSAFLSLRIVGEISSEAQRPCATELGD